MSKPISKDYLLTQFKNFNSVILQGKYQEIFQFDTLPTADADHVGMIVQYTGATTSTLTNGYFYICEEGEGSTYAWVQKSVQPGKDTTALEGQVSALEGQVGKDKTVNTYATKTDLVDIVNVLTGSTADGITGLINANAKDAKYDESTTIAEAIAAVASDATVTVEKLETAESGFSATYVVKQNGTAVGDKINIPKDWVLSNVELKTCETADQPEAGFVVGDKYFDFSFNTKDKTATVTHIYLKVNDLVDVYTAEQNATEVQVAISESNVISATLNTDLKASYDGAVSDVTTLKADVNTTGSVANTVYTTAKDAIYSQSGDTVVTIEAAIQSAASAGAIASVDSTDDVTLTISDDKVLTATLNYETTNIDFAKDWN